MDSGSTAFLESLKNGARYTIDARGCSRDEAIAFVRKHLDDGRLAKMCEKMAARFCNPMKKTDYTCHGHTLVILGACAMSLGCKFTGLPGYGTIFPKFRELLLSIYETAPLMDKAKEEMYDALQNCQDGQPGEFTGKTSLHFITERAAANIRTSLTQESFWGKTYTGGRPDSYKSTRGAGKAPYGGIMVAVQGPITKTDLYGASEIHGCGSCGKKTDSLSQCGKCKDIKYCGKNCQRADWKRHKGCCRTPEDWKDMAENPKKWLNEFYTIGGGLMERLSADRDVGVTEGYRKLILARWAAMLLSTLRCLGKIERSRSGRELR